MEVKWMSIEIEWRCSGSQMEVQLKSNGGVVEVKWRCSGSQMEV